jgi:hypothetical protein
VLPRYLVAADAGNTALRTIAAESATFILLNIFRISRLRFSTQRELFAANAAFHKS